MTLYKAITVIDGSRKWNENRGARDRERERGREDGGEKEGLRRERKERREIFSKSIPTVQECHIA